LDADAPPAAVYAPALTGWRAVLRDVAVMIRFHSRLPMPALPFETDPHAPPDFSRAAGTVPFAGLVIGLPGAGVLLLASWLGLPAMMAAGLAVAMAALVTGAMHEDGLADSFDGLGAGGPPERRLAIMRDSRVGAFGVTALVLALLLRVAGLAGLLAVAGPLGSALIALAAAAVSRGLMLLPIAILPPARPDGAASAVGRPTSRGLTRAIIWGCAWAGALTAAAGAAYLEAAVGVACALAFVGLMTWWTLRAIHGHTGDIAGACQQLAEIGFYLGLLTVLGGR
jgi:adenosylcobinamide-GDP ribazoletransferase